MRKYNIGDLVLVERPNYGDRKWILKIEWKSFRKLEEDLVPHRYYSGMQIGLHFNKDKKLYVPDENIGPSYSSYIKHSFVSPLNAFEVDLKKLIPSFQM